MIGNDIVDRSVARRDSNWQRKGFLEKLFTVHEQQLIRSAATPELMLWTLWSMKESAYKVVFRETERRFFAPQQLVCHLTAVRPEGAEGYVSYGRTYKTRSFITDHYVVSTAFATSPNQPVHEAVFSLERSDYRHQHEAVRNRIKKQCSAFFSIPETQIQLRTNVAGVPSLLIGDTFGNMTNRPISLSHHGHFGAFVTTR